MASTHALHCGGYTIARNAGCLCCSSCALPGCLFVGNSDGECDEAKCAPTFMFGEDLRAGCAWCEFRPTTFSSCRGVFGWMGVLSTAGPCTCANHQQAWSVKPCKVMRDSETVIAYNRDSCSRQMPHRHDHTACSTGGGGAGAPSRGHGQACQQRACVTGRARACLWRWFVPLASNLVKKSSGKKRKFIKLKALL